MPCCGMATDSALYGSYVYAQWAVVSDISMEYQSIYLLVIRQLFCETCIPCLPQYAVDGWNSDIPLRWHHNGL